MEQNDGNYLEYLLDSQFMIFWWLLQRKKGFLEKSKDGDWVENFFIVNILSAGGFFYFVKPDSY